VECVHEILKDISCHTFTEKFDAYVVIVK